MFPESKQNKLRQTKKIEINKESYLSHATIIKHAFHFLIFYFSSYFHLLIYSKFVQKQLFGDVLQNRCS